MSEPQPSKPAKPRPTRKVEIGLVTRDKTDKTRRVEIERLVPHPKYGKFLRKRTICHAHDENNVSHVGDLVEIMETRPMSKTKRWRIVRIVRQGAQRALEAMDAAARSGGEGTPETTS
jgi:small subunit ribosomal protein S17